MKYKSYQLKSRRGMILFKTQIFISRIKQELIQLSNSHVVSRNSAFLFCCSFAIIKPRQTNTQCYRVIQLRGVSTQQEGLKEEIFT